MTKNKVNSPRTGSSQLKPEARLTGCVLAREMDAGLELAREMDAGLESDIQKAFIKNVAWNNFPIWPAQLGMRRDAQDAPRGAPHKRLAAKQRARIRSDKLEKLFSGGILNC